MDDAPGEARLIELATREFPRLVGVAGLSCGSHAVAEEIAQEALLRLCQHWRRVAAMERPEAWLYRVTLNLAIRAGAKQRRQQVTERRWAMTRSVVVPPVDPADGTLIAAVGALPRRQQQAVICRHFLDLSTDDAADVLGCAPGTVRALTSQAMANLRQALDAPPRPRQQDPSHRSTP